MDSSSCPCSSSPGIRQEQPRQRQNGADAEGRRLGGENLAVRLIRYAVITGQVTDRDISGLRIAAMPTLSLPGEVEWAGEDSPPEGVRLSIAFQPITRTATRVERANVEVSIPGTFVKEGLMIDEFNLAIRDVPEGVYIKDITYGTNSILNKSFVPGSAMSGEGLRITLAGDGGEIHVRTVDEDGSPVVDVGVAVFPESVTTEAEMGSVMVTGRTDQIGAWTSPTLAPGSYYTIATLTRTLYPTPELVADLWRARIDADPVDLEPDGSADIEIEAR